MTICFVLLRLFFPGALVQPMIDQSNVTLLAMGKHTKPRSACLTRDSSNLCMSWATYATSKMTSAEEAEITRFSKECGLKGYSAEFKAALTNGDLLYVCVKCSQSL
ncbi:hypothetical protein N7491_001504 [Penicillium cf. griseofulvum]|uniref:Uncharacterized protein n=1 Tax=Penicillium cf. griseofulvum TaxID=2972120 RepID=A0A9W9MA00_9EURO|nr:hypothetical protein N7472_006635 [Penicillium cf. griseofulvum]KAJ5445422.1 hypothetical protein N7491_001504 [Penicillium cf. griseofulvum]KAJ5447142.1 hypothetical protein N7445_001963 [Penicillium cf. griseofulvum]